MDEKTINAVEMTRKIRDNHAKRLAGKSHAERMSFYRERAKKMEKKLPVLLTKLAVAESGQGDYSVDRHEWLDDQGMDTVLKRIREKRTTYKTKK